MIDILFFLLLFLFLLTSSTLLITIKIRNGVSFYTQQVSGLSTFLVPIPLSVAGNQLEYQASRPLKVISLGNFIIYLNDFKGMKRKGIIGIDVSKKTLDVFIHSAKHYLSVSNSYSGFPVLLEECQRHSSCDLEELFFCFEDTGGYSRLLSLLLQDSGIEFAMVPALEIKRSLGLKRGKTDRIDAKSIAEYAWQRRDELPSTVVNGAMEGELRQLLTLRDKLIRHRTAYKNNLKELQEIVSVGKTDCIRNIHTHMIEELTSQMSLVDSRIEALIATYLDWNTNYKLIQSVRGIGPVLAKYLIIYTENFTRINHPKSFACYAGIAPFEYSSGTSVKGRTRVHPFANKQLKSLLNTAAMSAIQSKGEYKTYFNRRTAEGKNKMSTLNIIRNKLVARVYAVVKRQTPYVDLTTCAA